MNHTLVQLVLWSMWGNNCDVLMPAYEREQTKNSPRPDGSRA